MFGDPVLRQRAVPVEKPSRVHRRLISNLFETMRDAPGIGLAAPQVGVLERIFVWEVGDEHGAVVNPRIARHSSTTVVEEEGCLSLPGLAYPVERWAEVTVEGVDAQGEPLVLEAEGLLARVFQHEIDHLDGVLFVDRLPPELRKEAMRKLTDLSLGLRATPTPTEEAL
jgi:peptide deformylase